MCASGSSFIALVRVEQLDVVLGVPVGAAEQRVLARLVAAEVALGDRGAVVRRVGVAARRSATRPVGALLAQRRGRRRTRHRRRRRSGSRPRAQTPLNSALRFSANALRPSVRVRGPEQPLDARRARARARRRSASRCPRRSSSLISPIAAVAPPASRSAYSRVFSAISAAREEAVEDAERVRLARADRGGR